MHKVRPSSLPEHSKAWVIGSNSFTFFKISSCDKFLTLIPMAPHFSTNFSLFSSISVTIILVAPLAFK